jgi:hypothetical protein
MVVYLSVCGNTLRQYTKRGKGQFTCQCVAILAFGRNAANKNGCPSHQCVKTLFPDLLRMTQGKLGCQFPGNTFKRYTKKDKGQLTYKCVAMLLAEMLQRRMCGLRISVWERFFQIC